MAAGEEEEEGFSASGSVEPSRRRRESGDWRGAERKWGLGEEPSKTEE